MPSKGIFPALLIVEEQRETFHFHIPDEESLYRVALNILTARLTSGAWYPNPEDRGPPDEPGYDAVKIPELPLSLHGFAEDLLAEYADCKQEYVSDLESFEQIEDAVRERKGDRAWVILQSRVGHENESLRLVVYCRKYHT